MDLHHKQEITVGALVLLAIAVFIAGALWLSGRSMGGSSDFIKLEFASAGNLKVGVPVRISGVTLGKVERISLIEPGRVMVEISLPARIVPKTDASARIISISTLGDAAVAFEPGTAGTPMPRDQLIKGSTEAGLTDQIGTLGDQAKTVLLGAQEIVNKRTADDLHATLEALQRTLNTLSERIPGPTAEATRTMQSLQKVTDRLDSLLAIPGLTRGLANLDTLTANLTRMTGQFVHTGASLDTLLANMNAGRGTLGRFAADTSLYTQMTGTLKSLQQLLDAIKAEPGKLTIQLKVF